MTSILASRAARWKAVSRRVLTAALAGAALALAWPSTAGAAEWPVTVWLKPFDFSGPSEDTTYTALERAQRPWSVCAAYPHLKDSYWLSVNYGMVEHARRLGIRLQVVEAGGYPNLDRQIAQVKECAKSADALILGAVSFDGLTPAVREIGARIPVIAAVNDIADDGIAAKALVSWRDMGRVIGESFARMHPKGSRPVKVAWFPGPREAGWVKFVEQGFREGIAESSADVVAVKWGDTGFEAQHLLVEEVLEERADVDYIIGSAVTADAAVSILRARGLENRIEILADYFTHGTFRAIKRGRVKAAPTDAPVVQGRLAVDMAVRTIEGSLTVRHAGPRITVVDFSTIDGVAVDDSLAPAWFTPTFAVP